MKKTKLIIAIVLLVAGLVLGAYSISRFMSASELYTAADMQEQKSYVAEYAGNYGEAADQIRYATMSVQFAKEASTEGVVVGGAGLVMIFAGGFLILKSRKS